MAKRNIFESLLHPELTPQRNGFDLSHRKILTMKAGELLPVLCEDMMPTDYFEIDTQSFLRTFPLNTAAFLRAKLCFDFFFVPKTAVWSRYNDFISQRVDKRSSYTRGSAFEPNISISFARTCVASAGVPESGAYSPIDSADARTKVLQLLGYGYIGGNNAVDYPVGAATAGKSLTALPIAGYNFIYNRYYRNPYRDEPNQYAIQNQNLDFVPCETYANSLVDNYVEYDFISMHYHGWYKDLFIGSLPNQQFGNVSSIRVTGGIDVNITTGTDAGRWSMSGLTPVSDSNVQYHINGSGTQELRTLNSDSRYSAIRHDHNVNFGAQLANNTGFDVLALRRAMALQKWKEYNMRAGYRNSSQQKAQYGAPTPNDYEHDLQYIDSFESNVMIDEVISTSNTSSPSSGNGNLGEIAGKGIGFGQSKKINFEARVPGYLYCIAYVIPNADYDAVGFDKSLMRSEPFDHYLPAFENIGMQPITLNQLNAQYGITNQNIGNTVIGYAPNYYEYKTRVDKCYGAFMDFLIENAAEPGQTPMPVKRPGSLSPWCSHRTDFLRLVQGQFVPTESFYVNPSCLDNVFVKSADGWKESDQFMLNLNFDIKAVRPMSVLGLPTI